MYKTGDTIVALATAPLAAGVAVVRLSGPQAIGVAEKLCPAFINAAPRLLVYGDIIADTGDIIDKALVVKFPAPHSFTGEDVVEIQCHGSLPVIETLLAECKKNPHVRAAEAGEFTRRAVLGGKLDLTQAEGLADLIAAETDEQRKQAQHQLQGALGEVFEKWRAQLLHLLAHVEAAIDFPDEELEVLHQAGLQEKLADLLTDMQSMLASHVGERLREGLRLAIIGAPNAGKSTLINLLTGRDTAIVSPIAGTTRDVVQAPVTINGFPITLSDTAGLRETGDIIEQEGIKRAHQNAATADIVLAVVACQDYLPKNDTPTPHIPAHVSVYLHVDKSLVVVSKTDIHLTEQCTLPAARTQDGNPLSTVGVNLLDGASAGVVRQALGQLVATQFGGTRQAALITRQRHRDCIEETVAHLQRALQVLTAPQAASRSELLAQDLRDAAAALGRTTGRTGTEDVLDVVFSSFCIGK